MGRPARNESTPLGASQLKEQIHTASRISQQQSERNLESSSLDSRHSPRLLRSLTYRRRSPLQIFSLSICQPGAPNADGSFQEFHQTPSCYRASSGVLLLAGTKSDDSNRLWRDIRGSRKWAEYLQRSPVRRSARGRVALAPPGCCRTLDGYAQGRGFCSCVHADGCVHARGDTSGSQ
jgi:hypothetical protein